MKKFLFVALLSIFSFTSFANHTKGGWLYYEYVGPGSSPNTLKYRVTLKLYTACILTSGQFDPSINFSVFDGSSNALVYSWSVSNSGLTDIQNCTTQECHPCINLIPSICYKIITYETTRDLPRTAGGYTIAYQRCCRISGIVNLQAPTNNVGETWTVKIPGTSVAGAEINSSARFSQNDTAIICQGARFTFDFSAIDPDGDSLVYDFTPAYSGGSTGNATPDPATNPPYSSIAYSGGFSGSQPMGSAVTINRTTGIVTGIGPGSGIYVLTCTVSEYRRGTNIKIAEVRKSLHIEVANCSLTQADLDPEYLSCDGFTVTFFNNASSANIQTYDWDFGDGNTSTLPSPTHTYADTGIYILKLAVNRGLPCSDSATAKVKVYPGFFPDFTMSGQCTTIPVQFNDITTVAYGVVNFWSWNFGDLASGIANTSSLQNPTHLYTTAQTYTVDFIVSSDKGCIDTLQKTIDILAGPPLTVPNDTLICVIDTLQLNAGGSGNFIWTPNYMINNVNIANPLVSPDITTTYVVTLTDPFGCSARDSVKVRVVNFVTQAGNYDTTICQTDPVLLHINSDALYFNWTPHNGTLSDSSVQNPTAIPLSTTTYHVVGSISAKCYAENDINVKVVPYPPANAGPDIPVCFGNSTQLHATGGSIYSWSPTVFLSNSHIPDPLVNNPTGSVKYIVTVRDVLGCPKPVNDTVIVRVIKINADAGPSDTSVVLGQPLQLGASGGTFYEWTPVTWLNDPTISNPISLPQNNISYTVKVSDANGCVGYDNIFVRVYYVKPDLFVPTGFSPNGDAINDIFRPILIGMKSLDLFRVFNRWGQLLYSSSGGEQVGWDGSFGGRPQEAGTYVWYAQGTDYLNKMIKKKGYVVLIR